MPETIAEIYPVPIGATERVGVGWWGLLFTIVSEVALFGYLIFAYAYLGVQLSPGEVSISHLSFVYSAPMTLLVILSSAALVAAEYGVRRGQQMMLVLGLAAALVLSLGFVALEYFEWTSEKLSPTSSALGSMFYLTTGLHLAHFIVGIIALLVMIPLAAFGYFDRVRHTHVSITTAYWHFVNATWVILFIALYCVPYIGL
jgi:cytochrome c oxidase subunit III